MKTNATYYKLSLYNEKRKMQTSAMVYIMAFDGITISCITEELNQTLLNGRIFKIAQPEPDELILTIKVNKEQLRLLISANASLPLIYLTNTNKQSPLTAPSFCMLLRKHIQNGRITQIYQPGLERAINIEIEHLNEMGDLCKKVLIVELMGKHSNIIFCDDNQKSLTVSNTLLPRQVLSARCYREENILFRRLRTN